MIEQRLIAFPNSLDRRWESPYEVAPRNISQNQVK